MVLDDGIARAIDGVLLAAADIHDVVRDEAVAAHDEIERDLALADAALAEQQDAQAVDLDQDPVQPHVRRQTLLEPRRHAPDELRAAERRGQ